MKLTSGTVDRVFGHVDVKDSLLECWPWTYSIMSKGYGQICIEGSMFKSHRLVYAAMLDWDFPFDPEIKIRHRCNNKICNNPSHLVHGTTQDNSRDYAESNVGKPRKCGHPRVPGTVRCHPCNNEYARKKRIADNEYVREMRIK